MAYSADETYDVYDERQVRARKSRRCDACKEAIAPGHRYVRVGIVFDGTASSIRRCLRCQAMHEALRARCTDADSWPDERLNCGEEYEPHWGEPTPPELARLAFVTAEEMQE